MGCKGELGTYSRTASSILCGASSDIDYLVFLDDLIVAFYGRERQRCERYTRLDNEGKNTLENVSPLRGSHRLL